MSRVVFGTTEDIAANEAARAQDHLTPEQLVKRLWTTVMKENLQLALDKKKKRPEERNAAKLWIGSADFKLVCELAGLDADAVTQRCRDGKIDIDSLAHAGREKLY